MFFNEVMALVLPSLTALLLYIKISNRKLSIFEGICTLALFNLVSNSLCYSIIYFYRGYESFLFTALFTVKYSVLSSFVNIVFVFVYRFFELNIKFKLKLESEEKDV